MAKQGPPTLCGRTRECEALSELVATLRTGSPRTMVLRGEAGVGKTALLEQLVSLATGVRVISVAGVESDMELAYAGLHQLVAPLLAFRAELPDPQRTALDVVFGADTGPPPDRFLVGLAILSLMAAAARQEPLLCVVDDAQWLDQVSVQTLGFVARRLFAEPIGLVFAVRDGCNVDVLADLPDLRIRGLSDADARDLLSSVMLGGIDPGVRDRVVAETRGNPLALLEVPRSVPAADLAGGFWTGTGRSVDQLEANYITRIRGLPPPTQRLLLLAAAEPVGDAALFLRAAARLGIPVDHLGAAEADQIIQFGPRMRFQHPLMRSAAYRGADLASRREIHGALAAETDPQSDPDRRAWHAAKAAAGPDDAVAAELEASAGRAQSRGGISAAAAFLQQATTLTADPIQRSTRALAAATAMRDAAAPDAAYELLSIAELGPLSELQRAQAIRLRAQMDFARGRGGLGGAAGIAGCAPALLEAARRLEPFDEYSSRESYLEAIAALMYAGRFGDSTALMQTAAAARAAINRASDLPRAVDLLLKGMAERIAGGPRAGSTPIRAALEAMCAQAEAGDVGRWLVPAFPILQESAAHELWDETILARLSSAVVRHAREAGALAGLPRALVYRAGVHLLAGEFGAAASLIDEADAITAATEHSAPVRYHALLIAAWRGELASATSVISAALADAQARGEGRLIGLCRYAEAVLHNGMGRYDEALAAARDGCSYEDIGPYSWCLFELIEAATRTGDIGTATATLELFEERAAASATDWGLGAVANARALVSSDKTAEPCYQEAIERLQRTRVVVHLARTHQHYGEWLRRMNRRTDAREQLTTAHEMFSRMGAAAYAERARRELVAVGAKVRSSPDRAGDQLTAQESQIAGLAADGLTNQEIGAQLFISVHTVEWHLRKVFVKLGVTSRRQLRNHARV